MSGGVRGRLLPVDRVAIGYFGCTGLVALVFGGLSGAGIAAAHAIAIFGITRLAAWHPRAGLAAIARGAYAVLITPLLYAELSVLNRFLTQRYFDATVQAWDAALFGGQPSIDLSAWLPWLSFSEVLHLGYFGYYAIIPAAILGVFATRGLEAFQRTALAVATAFFVSYLIFMFFPSPAPDTSLSRSAARSARVRCSGSCTGSWRPDRQRARPSPVPTSPLPWPGLWPPDARIGAGSGSSSSRNSR